LDSYNVEKAVQLSLAGMPEDPHMDTNTITFPQPILYSNLMRYIMVDGGIITMPLAKYDLYQWSKTASRESKLAISHQVYIDMSKALCDLRKHGIIHLDVKLDNILVMQSGKLVLTDFGHSVWQDEGYRAQRSQHWSIESPESLFGRVVCFETDYWSLGCCLCKLRYDYDIMQFTKTQPVHQWSERIQNICALVGHDIQASSLLSESPKDRKIT
jgi:serine/threonine protein kinase